MRYIIQMTALGMIGVAGWIAGSRLSSDAIALLLGMSIMLMGCIACATFVLAAQKDRTTEVQQRQQERRRQLHRPTYYTVDETPVARQKLTAQ